MTERKHYRYESPALKIWKKLTTDQQFNEVNELSQVFKDRLDLIEVRDQSIKVELSVEKSEIYDLLVEYETYLRENLDNIPIIVLLQGKTDANKKRQ